jgi:hypothetical protein
MNMISFESNRVFQDKYNCLESLKDYKSLEDHRCPEDHKSLEDHKKHRKLQDDEESGRPWSQEVHKSQRRLPGLKKPETKESGRLADYKSQESRE